MTLALIIGGFVLLGAVWTYVMGRGGLFDYTPTGSQVQPNSLKWFCFFFWWVMLPLETLCALGRGLQFLNRKANKFLNVRG